MCRRRFSQSSGGGVSRVRCHSPWHAGREDHLHHTSGTVSLPIFPSIPLPHLPGILSTMEVVNFRKATGGGAHKGAKGEVRSPYRRPPRGFPNLRCVRRGLKIDGRGPPQTGRRTKTRERIEEPIGTDFPTPDNLWNSEENSVGLNNE